jgi:sucrose-6-phosphate hydrolase SacC (GH32 family)
MLYLPDCRSTLKALLVCLCILPGIGLHAQPVNMKITKHYLNIPVEKSARVKPVKINVDGQMKMEFPVKLAEDTVDFWVYADVSEFTGKKIELACPASAASLKRIYQDDHIAGSDSVYREMNRPQFHFTVKRGWSNDINGPIYYDGQYHLFWQTFKYGLDIDIDYMYWGHAVSNDLLHWTELPSALTMDSLGSPWSGTAVVDSNNMSGFGKNAMVLYYTAFDKWSGKQVQCMAYSTDGGKTFQRYAGNPIIDSNREWDTNDTRDPKVFWYEPSKVWVMVLFEKDGMSIFNSTDMKAWKRRSHIKGLYECPDMFPLSVDGDPLNIKWVMHGGSSAYLIGNFNGKVFTPETEKLEYAEGKNNDDNDLLYAAQSFGNMPDGRRVQMAWGRIQHYGMPFTQMMLFPTAFSIITTNEGLRMVANPVAEIDRLHAASHVWGRLSIAEANDKLRAIAPAPLHVKMNVSLQPGADLRLRYEGSEMLHLPATDLPEVKNDIEILLDKTVAEIFVNKGRKYIIKQLAPPLKPDEGLVFESFQYGPQINALEVYEMRSVWR